MTDSPNSSVPVATPSGTETGHKQYPKEGRNVWILTIYAITGLGFFGVLAFYISNYFAK